jgi:hypothetical protein
MTYTIVVDPLTDARALAASTAPISVEEVVPSVRVTLRTVGLGSIGRVPPDAAQQILALRDDLKMSRVNARWGSAEVVDDQPPRYWTDQKLIGEASDADRVAIVRIMKYPIAVGVEATSPEPVFGPERDFRPEAVFARLTHVDPPIQGRPEARSSLLAGLSNCSAQVGPQGTA